MIIPTTTFARFRAYGKNGLAPDIALRLAYAEAVENKCPAGLLIAEYECWHVEKV